MSRHKGTIFMKYTLADIQRYLLRLYQGKLATKERVSISHLTDKSGWENYVFSFTLRYEEDHRCRHKNLFIKIYPGESGMHKAIGEFYSMQELALVGYPVPKVLSIELDDAAPAVIMEKVPGPLLLDLLSGASPGRRQELISLFCQLFVELHSLDWQTFVIDPNEYQTPQVVQRTLAEEYMHAPPYHVQAFRPVMEWLRERSQAIRSERLSIIHQDYHPGNIIITEDGTGCVIDWTQTEVSDYRFDLAWTLLLLSTIEGPELRDDVLREYERYAGQRVLDLDFFEVVACLKRLLEPPVSQTAPQEQYRRSLLVALTTLQTRTGISLPEAVTNFQAL